MLFDSILFTILECLAMFAVIISLFYVMSATKENQDELSIRNYDKARSHTLTFMHIIIFVIIIILKIYGVLFNNSTLAADVKSLIVPYFFIVIGIEYIITNIFRKYERDGDECIY